MDNFDKETAAIDLEHNILRGHSVAQMEKRFDRQPHKRSTGEPPYTNPSIIEKITGSMATIAPENGKKAFQIKLQLPLLLR